MKNLINLVLLSAFIVQLARETLGSWNEREETEDEEGCHVVLR